MYLLSLSPCLLVSWFLCLFVPLSLCLSPTSFQLVCFLSLCFFLPVCFSSFLFLISFCFKFPSVCCSFLLSVCLFVPLSLSPSVSLDSLAARLFSVSLFIIFFCLSVPQFVTLSFYLYSVTQSLSNSLLS